MIIKKYFGLLVLYILVGYASLLFDSRLIIFEQIKILSPYIFLLVIICCLFIVDSFKYFIFVAACTIFFLMNTEFVSVSQLNNLKTEQFNLIISDQVKLVINQSKNCKLGKFSTVCADNIIELDEFFGSDLDCKIDAFISKNTPIFLINREISINAEDIYQQKVCLRRLTTFFKREKISGIVAGNFGTFSSASSVRLLSDTVKINETLTIDNFIVKLFSLSPPGYVFLPMQRVNSFNLKNNVYDFEMKLL